MTRTLTAQQLSPLTDSHRLPLVAALAVQFACVVTRWDQRYRSRRALRRLDAHALRDIGITRRQAEHEAKRMFWRH